MILIKGNHTEIAGTGEELIVECARALYSLINAQSNESGKPFAKTAEWLITTVTNVVFEINKFKGESK